MRPFGAQAQAAKDHFQKGIALHRQQEYKAAIHDYSKAIKADKEFTEAYYNRGTCYLGLKDYKAAILDFTKALELDADFAKAYYSRATVRVGQNDFAGAENSSRIFTAPALAKKSVLDTIFLTDRMKT